ncbi:Terminal uridylyltransferase 4 [Araneus ventricosus]|uniref:Terminal uridylyltransferase 4 n=1 Tax=Araneus ventricosus TaxID=182803 RepID=A0A4Y2GJ05_ARAVE|nr:Terminal uridylyltransferase 4 [Araneus ventricosus]
MISEETLPIPKDGDSEKVRDHDHLSIRAMCRSRIIRRTLTQYLAHLKSKSRVHPQGVYPDSCLSPISCLEPLGGEIRDLDNTLIIEKIAEELRKHPELENVLPITSAKVPIVKFSWRSTGLEGDISLYNTLALVNTEMLEAYTKIDSRVQVLGYALKHLAKVLGICDASRGSLSSYAYILMVIYFLQQRSTPVIPVLQELYGDGEKPSEMVENWNVYFFRDLDRLKDVWPDYGKNKESVGELWLGLLSFYTCEFNWKEYVISIRQKKPISRFKKLWNTDQLAIEEHVISIRQKKTLSRFKKRWNTNQLAIEGMLIIF